MLGSNSSNTIKKILLLLGLIGSIPSAFSHPGIGLVKDSKGNVYYTDLAQVWKIDLQGNKSIAVADVHTHELYIDANDNLYGEHEWYNGEAKDTWGNYIWCLGFDGQLEKSVPDIEGFLENNTLVRNEKDHCFWSKKKDGIEFIFQSDPNNQTEQYCAEAFQDIRWMHYSTYDQHLYVVDYLSLKKVDQEGNVSTLIKNLKKSSALFDGVDDRHYVMGITTDKKLNVYVSLYGSGEVIKITPTGEEKVVYKADFWWSPIACIPNHLGKMWVLEFSKSNKTRLLSIDEEGEKLIYTD